MRAMAATRIAVVAAILAVVSLLSLNYFGRADLTARKEFTISESSRRLLSDLTDIVNVTVYMSENLPQHMTGFRTRVEDVLEEYRAYGGDRLRITFTDPSADPEIEQKVRMLGIPPVQLQALERDRAEVVTAYLGMTVMFEDRQEVIPLLVSTDRLEYDLTSAILKVMSESPPVVGFLTGHGEPTIRDDYAPAAEALRQSYGVREVTLEGGGSVPPDVVTLVVAGPGEIPDVELYEIDQFIMRGGRALFLLDGAVMPQTGLRAQPAQGTVFSYAGTYGATVNTDLVVDRVNSNASFQSGFLTLAMPYPYWPKAVSPNISTENPAVSDLDAITFPWTSSVTVSGNLLETVTATVLARSSGYSWTVPAHADLNPQQRFEPAGEDAAKILAGQGEGVPLAVALVGEFASAFSGKPLLIEQDGKPAQVEPETRLDKSPRTQIVVVGNSRMFEGPLLRQFPSNVVLFLNLIDWLTLGDTLIGIRSRAVQDRPLTEISDAQKATVKFLATFGTPIVVVAFGLIRTALRRRRKTSARANAALA